MVIEGVSTNKNMQGTQPTVKVSDNTDVAASAPKAQTVIREKDYSKQSEGKETERGVSVSENEMKPISEKASNEQLKKALEKFNKNMGNSEAIFGVHEDTNRIIIKIIDKDTKETIKELPPEKTLDMIAKVWEMAGILVDEKL